MKNNKKRKKEYYDMIVIFAIIVITLIINVKARPEETAGGTDTAHSSSSSRPTAAPTATPEPTPCPAGMAGSNGNCSDCDGVLEYTSRSGKRVCSTCGSGEIANSTHTGCVTAPVTFLSSPGFTNIYLALSESCNSKTLTAKTYDGATLGTVSWSGPGAGFSLSGGNTQKALTFTGGVGTYHYSVTASAGGGSATASGTYQRYNCNWSERAINVIYKSAKPNFSTHLVASGCDFYTPNGTITNSSGQMGYKYSMFHSRCCNTSVPSSDFGGCYGDEPYIGIATEVGWSFMDSPFTKNGKNLKYRYNDIGNEGACHTMASGNTCSETSGNPSPKNVSTSKCEDTVNFQLTNAVSTCAGSSSFYSISCVKDVKTAFDYGDDGDTHTSNKLKNGQGFKFRIDVKTDVTCVATFNATPWKESYDRVMEKLKTVKSRRDRTFTKTGYQAYQESARANDKDKWDNYIAELKRRDDQGNDSYTRSTISFLYYEYNLAQDLEQVVKTYNDYRLEDEFNEETNLSMSYNVNGVRKNFNYNFTKEVNDSEGRKIYTSGPHNLGVSWLTNPRNYKWLKNRTVKLYPQKTMIDRHIGIRTDVANSDTMVVDLTRDVDGGNKIYLDYDTDFPQTITPINITVSNLGGNGSSVTNNMCSIELSTSKFSYRPVDVSNPFINDSWEKGENWINDEYDFTNTIHASTWSETARNEIRLSSSDIKDLKTSTATYRNNGYSPYLGICELLNSTSQDSITQNICSKIR